MLSLLKRFILGLGKVFAIIFLLFTIFAGYGFFAEHSAKKKSAAMCASIKPGQDPATLLDLAIADGASEFQTRWVKADGLDTLFITYIGLPPFSRHICLVQAKDDHIVSVRQVYLD